MPTCRRVLAPMRAGTFGEVTDVLGPHLFVMDEPRWFAFRIVVTGKIDLAQLTAIRVNELPSQDGEVLADVGSRILRATWIQTFTMGCRQLEYKARSIT